MTNDPPTLHPVGATGTAQAAQLAGISYRTVDYWIRKQYVHVFTYHEDESPWRVPYPHSPGSGHSRYLLPHELDVLLLMARLNRAGILPHTAARAARTLVDNPTHETIPLTEHVHLTITRPPSTQDTPPVDNPVDNPS